MPIRNSLYVIVTIFVYQSSALSICENKNALHSVNASVQPNKWSRRSAVNTNFYLLDNYSIIDVHQANVTDLCEGMIKNFPRLEALYLMNINLSRLRHHVFQNVPKLRILSLAVNHLTKIVKESFEGLPALEVLYLSANKISYIEENSFANMRYLKEIHIDRNKLTDINGNLFAGSPNVATIDFRFNLIQTIVEISFEDLRATTAQRLRILLSKNQINDIAAEAFERLPPVSLHLEDNKLNMISQLFHMIPDGSRLYLNRNLFTCIAEDVLENIKDSNKYLYLLNNPLDCQCVQNMDRVLSEDYTATERFIYNSTLPCNFGYPLMF